MKKTVFRWVALCLVMLFMLTGCDPILPQLMDQGSYGQAVAFQDMEYSRQDVAEIETLQQAVLDGIDAQDSVETLMERFLPFTKPLTITIPVMLWQIFITAKI